MSFYSVLSTYYDVIFPSNPTQMNFLSKYIAGHSKILDIAAGAGNQAFELAQLGHEVTAIDIDPSMVQKMQLKQEADLFQLNAMQMDMRNINQFGSNSFDVVICIGNSIVHLNSLEEIKETIKKMFTIAHEDGTVIIQVVNYDRILHESITKLPIIERKEHGLTFIRSYEPKGSKILFNGTLMVNQGDSEETFNNSVELYPLTSRELEETFADAGFKKIQLFGDFKGSPFSIKSPALIGVAQK